MNDYQYACQYFDLKLKNEDLKSAIDLWYEYIANRRITSIHLWNDLEALLKYFVKRRL